MNGVERSAGPPAGPSVGIGRHILAIWLNLVITAGVAFVIMWPLGVFEGQEAYGREQFLPRLLALLTGSFLLANGWLLLKRRQTLGGKIVGTRRNAVPLPRWWKVALLAILVMIAAALPLVFMIVSLF